MKCEMVILVMLIACTFAIPALAQKEISESQFNTVREKGYEHLRKLSHRVTQIVDTDVERRRSGPELLISKVSEFQAPDRRRSVRVWKTAAGIKTTEDIEIGTRKFSRVNQGPWNEVKDDLNRYTIMGGRAVTKVNRTFRSVGRDRIGDIEVEIYESLIRSDDERPAGTIMSETLRRIWVGRDGRHIKEEFRLSDGNKLSATSITEYDYDRKVRIEAPIQ